MAKGPAREPSEPVKLPCSPEDLRKVAERLKIRASKLLGYAKAMETAGLATIEVKGWKMLERGLKNIDKFAGSVAAQIEEQT